MATDTADYGLEFRNASITNPTEYQHTQSLIELLTLDYTSNRDRILELASRILFVIPEKFDSRSFRQWLVDQLAIRAAHWESSRSPEPRWTFIYPNYNLLNWHGTPTRYYPRHDRDFDGDELPAQPNIGFDGQGGLIHHRFAAPMSADLDHDEMAIFGQDLLD